MADRLIVNPDDVVRLSRDYMALADAAMAALRQLKAALEAQGEPWGDDEPGRTFAESYLPALHQLLDGLHMVAESARTHGENLAGFAEAVVVQDNAIDATLRGFGDSTGASPFNSAVPTTNPSNSALRTATTPVTSGDPSTTSTSAEQAEDSPGEQPASASPTASSGGATQPGRTPQLPSAIQQPTSPAQDMIPPSPQHQSPQQRARFAAEHGRAVGRPTTATATSVGTSPTASPSTGPPRVSGPGSPQQRPGVITGIDEPSPRGGGPGRNANAARAKQNESRAGTSQSRIERHGVALSGLDNPEVDDDVLAELAAALDDVLPSYPAIDLREVAISELPRNEVSTAMWNWLPGPDGPRCYTARIVLAAAAARDPQSLADRVHKAVESHELIPGSDERPVYSTIVRELGRALDVAGCFRARRQVQRALLRDYLPTVGRQAGPRIVLDSYREWRSGLCGYAFHGRRLHPGKALAEAFTDVHLHGVAASGPSRVLHQLLVETARG